MRLVEGVGAIHHLGGRGRACGQHGAQGLVAAEHRCEVLHLLCELLDLLAQSGVLFLQVFALLWRREGSALDINVGPGPKGWEQEEPDSIDRHIGGAGHRGICTCEWVHVCAYVCSVMYVCIV